MRTIDADALKKRFIPNQCYFTEAIMHKIDTAPGIQQEPRVLSLDELQALNEGAVVWGEHCYKADGGYTPSTMAAMMRSGTKLVCAGCELKIEERMFTHPFNWFEDNERFRFWSAKPTDEQREATPWRS